MNGAVTDSTFNVFFKLKYSKIYDAMLATPVAPRDIALGEIGWALAAERSTRPAFLRRDARAWAWSSSWWAVLVLPVGGAHRLRVRRRPAWPRRRTCAAGRTSSGSS